jgi:hypothetical protein
MLYSFYLDQKVTTWMRTPFDIEANSIEEAEEKAIKFIKGEEIHDIEWEELEYIIKETISPEENGGQATEELYIENVSEDKFPKLIFDNTKL